MFYNSTIKNCQCNLGYYLNNNACLPEGSQCNTALHFVYNSGTKQCECDQNYLISPDGTKCLSKL